VLAQFAITLLMPEIHRDTRPTPLIDLHFSVGLVIVALMAVRWANRLARPAPGVLPGTSSRERLMASATHAALYGLLLTAPFLGWASASAHGLPVHLFGWVKLPELAAQRARWALQAGDVHALLMWATLALIALHVAAALFHQLGRRDGTMQRILP
jgi:cytochrome b561